MKKYFIILIFALIFINTITAQSVPDIRFDEPLITAGEVVNSSYYFGPISIGADYSGELPFGGLDKQAFYSIDEGVNWTELPQIDEQAIVTAFGASSSVPFYDIERFHNGNYLAAYTVVENSRLTLYFRTFDAQGLPVSEKTQVYANDASFESFAMTPPKIRILRNDNFVVFWNYYQPVENKYYIYGQIYDSAGEIVNVVSLQTPYDIGSGQAWHNQSFDILAYDTKFAVVWTQSDTTGSSVLTRWFTFEGDETTIVTPTTPPAAPYTGMLIKSSTALKQYSSPLIRKLKNESLLITWKTANGLEGAIVEKINPAPTPPSVLFISGSIDQYNITEIGDDNFVVSWTRMYNNYPQVYIQKFNTALSAVGSSIRLTDNANYILPLSSNNFPFLINNNENILSGWVELDMNTNTYITRIKKMDPNLQVILDRNIHASATPVFSMSIKKLLDNSIILMKPELDTEDAVYLLKGEVYNGKKNLTVTNLTPEKDIAIQFKVTDNSINQTWISPVSAYRYAPDDSGISIEYTNGYTSAMQETVRIIVEPGRYLNLEIFSRKAAINNEITDAYSEWQLLETLDPVSQTAVYDLDDGYAYQFRARITNFRNWTYDSGNTNAVICDRTPPVIRIVDQNLIDNNLTLSLDLQDNTSGIDTSLCTVNYGAAIEFGGENPVIPLAAGTNHIILETFDRAGNKTVKHHFRTIENVTPQLTILNIDPERSYSKLKFQYTSTVQLYETLFAIDETEITYASDQGGLVTINLDSFSDGLHKLTVKGRIFDGTWIESSVWFKLSHSAFDLILLCPAGRNYGTNDIPIDYSSSRALERIWYSLDNLPEKSDPILNDLADGVHTIKFFAQDKMGYMTSIETSFSVTEKFPELSIISPEEGKIYPDREMEIIFDTNADITYSVSGLTGAIESGAAIELPADGDYELTLTAIHPVSGNIIRKTVRFTIDSLNPEIEIIHPVAGIYPYRDINIDYHANKNIKSAAFLLDGNPVDVLTDMSYGLHELEIRCEDFAGRTASEFVSFHIVLLEIQSPADNAKIISEQNPPVMSYVYNADDSFQSITRAIDDDPEHLITQAPGTEIPLEIPAGNRELKVKGYINTSHISRRVNFQIGRKNITAGPGSIDYRYVKQASGDLYDVTAILRIRNTGHIDVSDIIQIRFDHITPAGTVKTYYRESPGLKVTENSMATITGITAEFGDTFLISVDQDKRLAGEYSADNYHTLVFQAGEITSITPAIPDDNVFLEDVSLFNVMSVTTAGPISRVEYHTPDKIFIDNTPENGFVSIVDMGLLTAEKDSVQILAYGENGILLDSYNYNFNVRKRPANIGETRFPWGAFVSLSDNTFKRIIMSEINTKELALAESRTIRNTLALPPAAIPVLDDEQLLTYKLIYTTAKESLSNLTTPVDFGGVPGIGGVFNLPSNKSYLEILSLDPKGNTISLEGVIPVIDDLSGYNGILDAVWQSTIEQVEKSINNQIHIEELINEAVNNFFRSDDDLIKCRLWKFFYIGTNPDALFGLYVMGFLDYSINDHVDITASSLNLKIDISDIDYRISLLPDKTIDISGGCHTSLDIKSSIGITTYSSRGCIHALIGISFFNRFLSVPITGLYGSFRLYPQYFHIPFHLNMEAALVLHNTELGFYPASTHFDISMNHDARLFDFDIALFIPFLWPFAAGYEFKANLQIASSAKADIIYSSNPDFSPNPNVLIYAKGGLSLEVFKREKWGINIFGIEIVHRSNWMRERDMSMDIQGTIGSNYSDQDVLSLKEWGSLNNPLSD